MEYFQVLIIDKDNTEEKIKDLSEDELQNKIVKPYETGSNIFVNGTSIDSMGIGRVHIRRTSETYGAISDRLYREEDMERNRSASQGYLDLSPYEYHKKVFWQGSDVLDQYISGPPGYKSQPSTEKEKDKIKKTSSSRVFIVHGHNEEMKQSSARFIEGLGLKAVILHEQPNKGRTIIEKFSDYSDVCYAIVLLSGDDLGFVKGDSVENAKLRARQNVVLELGYFLGKLGREKVAAVYEKNADLEIPSDFSGVLYIEYSGDDGWKFNLAKELKASGFEIDMNKIF